MLWRLKIVSISDEDASVLPAPLFMINLSFSDCCETDASWKVLCSNINARPFERLHICKVIRVPLAKFQKGKASLERMISLSLQPLSGKIGGGCDFIFHLELN
jgi:hypothetical protein